MSDSHERAGFSLSLFVRCREDGAETETKKRIFSVSREADSAGTEVLIPEPDEIVSTGWLPEITCRRDGNHEYSEIVIRPNPDRFTALPLNAPPPATLKVAPSSHGQGTLPAGSVPPPDSPPESADDEIAYRVTFENREIRINGFRLSKPNFDSENEVVFDFVFRNPNRKIELAEIETAIGRAIVKKLYDIVRSLGFIKEMKSIFFPYISKTAITFINPVSKTEFLRRGLSPPAITEKG
jgi:hypothetical protein